MSGQIIKDFFDRFKELPISFWDGLYEIAEIVQFRSDEVLKEVGNTARFLYFSLAQDNGSGSGLAII